MSARSVLGVCVLAAAASGPVTAGAEDAPVGTRVRVFVKGGHERVTGRLVAREAERLAVETAPGKAPVRIPYAQVARLQVSDGRSRSRGALLGTGIGLLVATGAYAAIDSDCHGSDCTKRYAVMAGSGMLAGALVGSRFATEKWRSVDQIPPVTSLELAPGLRLGLAPARTGGVRLAAAWSF